MSKIYMMNYKADTCIGAKKILKALFQLVTENSKTNFTYKEVSEKAGFVWGVNIASSMIGHFAGIISNCCQIAGLPRINTLIINEKSGKAGGGAAEENSEFELAQSHLWCQVDFEKLDNLIDIYIDIASKDKGKTTDQWLYHLIRREWLNAGKPKGMDRDEIIAKLSDGCSLADVFPASVI